MSNTNKIMNIQFHKHHVAELTRILENEIEFVSDDINILIEEPECVISMLESLYLLGSKANAKAFKKDIIEKLRQFRTLPHEAAFEDEEIKTAITKIKAVDFKDFKDTKLPETKVKASDFKGFDSNDWTNYLTKLLGLNPTAARELLHDINNLRGDEWVEVLIVNNAGSVITNKFLKFCKNPIIN